jgi:hypothetical protein
MRSIYLFPNKFRLIGWLLLVPGAVLGILHLYWAYEIPGFVLKLRETGSLFQSAYENFTNELALCLVITGLLFIAFAKEKREDELLSKIRLNALYWAILVNYAIYFILALILISGHVITSNVDAFKDSDDVLGSIFYQVLIYNMLTPLIIFIIRYQYLAHRNKDTYIIDKLYYLPQKPFKRIGILLSVPLVCLALYHVYDLWMPDYLSILSYFAPVTLLLWAYTKSGNEDEYISLLRLQCMQVAVLAYYGVILMANLFLYSLAFSEVMFLSTVIIALVFIITFSVRTQKHKREIQKGAFAL